MARNKVFIDSSALIAYLRQNDSCHERAVKIWEELKKEKAIFVLTNFILSEFLTIVRQRIGIKAAIEAGRLIRRGKIFEKVIINEILEEKAWEIFKKSRIKDLSFTDCTSAACMQKLKIKKIFTFDKHFKRLGYKGIWD